MPPDTPTAADGPDNLLRNPGAEAAGPSVPYWAATQGYRRTAYGTAGEYPATQVATQQVGGPGLGGGSSFFDPGRADRAVMTQDVDLAAAMWNAYTGERARPNIDADRAAVLLSGWLGGYGMSPDTTELVLTFMDGGGEELGSSRLAGPTASERQYETRLVQVGALVAVPAGTRTARVQVIATRHAGADPNHGFADELGLTIGSRPGNDGFVDVPGIVPVEAPDGIQPPAA